MVLRSETTQTINKNAFGLSAVWSSAGNLPHLSRWGRCRNLVSQAWHSFTVSPLVSVVTVLTMTLALFFFAGFMVLISNLSSFLQATHGEQVMHVYLRDDAAADRISAFENRLSENREIETYRYRSKEEALQVMRTSLGQRSDLLQGLESDNPLPASFEVKLKQAYLSPEEFARLALEFGSDAAVENVQYSAGFIAQLSGLLSTFKVLGIIGMILMVVVTSFIIGNTIKLALYSRRDELEIMKLVGATDRFIRVPCLLEGCLQGLVAGVIGIALAYLANSLLTEFLAESSVLAFLSVDLNFLSYRFQALVIFLGIFVGALGSHMAVNSFVSEKRE